jgi:predicted O-methyltransferase YrrM
MYSSFTILKKYIAYYLKASNGKGHGIHSPFVYSFIREVINTKTDDDLPKKIEAVRQKLLGDETVLEVEDFGAGSASGLTNKRTVKRIASTSLKTRKYAALLYRILQRNEPKITVELGTSLGITTSYLASAVPSGCVYTFEGADPVAEKAKSVFDLLQLKNINLIKGSFQKTLPEFLENINQIDFAFIDGHHQYEATVRYFEWLLPKIPESGIIILDDIHWSKGMEQAWEEIRRHPRVKISIDLFFVGILFFRSEQFEQEHFTIRF